MKVSELNKLVEFDRGDISLMNDVKNREAKKKARQEAEAALKKAEEESKKSRKDRLHNHDKKAKKISPKEKAELERMNKVNKEKTKCETAPTNVEAKFDPKTEKCNIKKKGLLGKVRSLLKKN